MSKYSLKYVKNAPKRAVFHYFQGISGHFSTIYKNFSSGSRQYYQYYLVLSGRITSNTYGPRRGPLVLEVRATTSTQYQCNLQQQLPLLLIVTLVLTSGSSATTSGYQCSNQQQLLLSVVATSTNQLSLLVTTSREYQM